MLKNQIFKFSLIAVLLVSISSEVFADIRVRFAKGRSSATYSGKIGSGGRVCYVAGARAGQTLTATVSSRSGKVQIFESGDTSYRMDVDYSGDQSICVDNIRGATSYTLTVSIR
jgi:hypothetical protein